MMDRSGGHSAPLEVEFRHDVDASRWMLATRASQNPERWTVTLVDPSGRRTIESGETGRRHVFPGLGFSRGQEVPWMWAVEGACHVEMVHPETGETIRRKVRFATCEHLSAPSRGEDPHAPDADAIKAELSQRLNELRPRRTWASVLDDGDIWHRTEDVWDLRDPPEDHALPPVLLWSEELRQLALSEYRATFDKYLEPDGHHDITWPPEGFLTSPGRWYATDPGLCGEHGDEYVDDCEECQDLDTVGQVVVDADATWAWTVEVETWGPQENADGTASIELLETDPWTIGYTDVDPREVEYGPVKGSPERAELVRKYWQSVRRAASE